MQPTAGDEEPHGDIESPVVLKTRIQVVWSGSCPGYRLIMAAAELAMAGATLLSIVENNLQVQAPVKLCPPTYPESLPTRIGRYLSSHILPAGLSGDFGCMRDDRINHRRYDILDGSQCMQVSC